MGYADIGGINATGAEPQTACQDHLNFSGKRASHKMAQTDLNRVMKYQSEINRVAKRTRIDPALIAAIMSRESRAGNALKDGWGDHGNAWGLMQVDKRYHPKLFGGWDSEEHISQATHILVEFIDRIGNKFPSWSKEMKLKGAVAAYNIGQDNVKSDNVDRYTTNGDYSNDVISRAQWYKSQGFGFLVFDKGNQMKAL